MNGGKWRNRWLRKSRGIPLETSRSLTPDRARPERHQRRIKSSKLQSRNDLFDHIAILLGIFGAGLGAGLDLVVSHDFDIMSVAPVVGKVLVPLADFDEITHPFVINRHLELWYFDYPILTPP